MVKLKLLPRCTWTKCSHTHTHTHTHTDTVYSLPLSEQQSPSELLHFKAQRRLVSCPQIMDESAGLSDRSWACLHFTLLPLHFVSVYMASCSDHHSLVFHVNESSASVQKELLLQVHIDVEYLAVLTMWHCAHNQTVMHYFTHGVYK